MCDPLTLLAIGSVAVEGVAANMQASHQEDLNRETLSLQEKQYDINQGILSRQQAEANEATSRDIIQARLIAQKDQAQARTSAGEAGVSGVSVQEQLFDFKLQESLHIETLRRSNTLRNTAIGSNKRGQSASMDLTNFRLSQPESRISPIAIGVSAATAGYQAFRSNPSRRAKRKDSK